MSTIKGLYARKCAEDGMPLPMDNPREVDHLKACEGCRQTWPFFCFDRMRRGQIVTDVHVEWCAMPERRRLTLTKSLERAQRQWVREMTKRPPTGYHLFVKTQVESCRSMSPEERARVLGERWKNLSEEERKPFTDRADEAKAQRQSELQHMPLYQKRVLQNHKRKKLHDRRLTGKKRPRNAYNYFVCDRLAEARQDDPKVQLRDILKVSGPIWGDMDEASREPWLKKARLAQS